MGMATLTLKEAFAGGFTAGADVLLTLVGVPDKAIVTVSHPGFDETVDAENPAGVAGDVTLNGDTTTIVTAGMLPMPSPTSMLVLTGDGDKLNITVGFSGDGPNAASTETLKLMFDLDARSSVKDIMLPLDEGKVEVWVTMAPTEKPTPVMAGTEYFAVNYMPADGVVAFTIAPASCTLLFPYAASLMGDWDTGIAIANPSAFTTPLSGSITFTLFPNDADMVEYPTNDLSPGMGLDPDGFLPAGNTYTVLLSDILDSADFSGDFIGHFYVKTDFTGCRGMAYVTDFQSGAQAYLPYFGDNLDEGKVPSNTSSQ